MQKHENRKWNVINKRLLQFMLGSWTLLPEERNPSVGPLNVWRTKTKPSFRGSSSIHLKGRPLITQLWKKTFPIDQITMAVRARYPPVIDSMFHTAQVQGCALLRHSIPAEFRRFVAGMWRQRTRFNPRALHFCVHKTMPLDPVLCQINPVDIYPH